jgi:hypothetical protein
MHTWITGCSEGEANSYTPDCLTATISHTYIHACIHGQAVLKEKQIALGFTPDCLTETTADLTVALLMTTARRLGEAIAAAK